MKSDKEKKIQEPFPPEQAPNPPQVIDPSPKKERNEPDKPVENPEARENRGKASAEESSKNKLLSEDTEIDDDTTI